MRLSSGLVLVYFITVSCGQKTVESSAVKPDTLPDPAPAKKAISVADVFLDSNFPFLNLDSLSEDMLRDQSVKKDIKYIQPIKTLSKEHCIFFKIGCTDSFWDEYCFLVSKQKQIGEITPVIIHDSKDFNYYHAILYTLDKNYRKIDSLMVSLEGSDMAGDGPYSLVRQRSKFNNEFITTTELEYQLFDNDSTVTIDSTVAHRKIDKDGRIITIKKEKIL